MTALFDQPVRATTTNPERQVLILGVVSETYGIGESLATSIKFMVGRPDGEVYLVDVDGVLLNWRYGIIPSGSRQGELGWYDFVPEGEEEPRNPVDEDDDNP